MNSADEEQFRQFVLASSGRLLRTAYLLTGDRGHAEDLLQTALLNTYRHWRRLRTDQPEAFVRKAMVNQCASWWRRRRVREVFTALLPDRPTETDAAARVGVADEVRRALLALPVRTRTVLVLRFWDDLSERDIARTMGCSVGTVKSHASRGLARLRLILAQRSPDPGTPDQPARIPGPRTAAHEGPGARVARPGVPRMEAPL